MFHYLVATNDLDLVIVINDSPPSKTHSLMWRGKNQASGSLTTCKRRAREYTNMPRLIWKKDNYEGNRRIELAMF